MVIATDLISGLRDEKNIIKDILKKLEEAKAKGTKSVELSVGCDIYRIDNVIKAIEEYGYKVKFCSPLNTIALSYDLTISI